MSGEDAMRNDAYLEGSRWEDPYLEVGVPFREDPFLVEGRGAHLGDPSFRAAEGMVDDLYKLRVEV